MIPVCLRHTFNSATVDDPVSLTHGSAEPSKPRSLAEWLTTFLENGDAAYYENMEIDDWEDGTGFADDYYDEIDESIIDTLVILGLAGVLAFLVYYRNQAAERARRLREQQERLQQQAGGAHPGERGNGQGQTGEERRQGGAPADGGFFPPPDDPNFNAWVAGGVGH